MKFDAPTRTVFYTVEKTIKQYRKMSQKNISAVVSDITIDQALLLIILEEHPGYSQKEIGGILFREDASITRMISLMVRNGLLKKGTHPEDKRRSSLQITKKGQEYIALLIPVIGRNRALALHSIDKREVSMVEEVLRKVIRNCSGRESS